MWARCPATVQRGVTPHRPYATVSLYWHFVDFVWICRPAAVRDSKHFRDSSWSLIASSMRKRSPPKRLWFGYDDRRRRLADSGLHRLADRLARLWLFRHVSPFDPHWDGRVLAFVITVVLFVIALAAGITSYRNWRALSQRDRTCSKPERHGASGIRGVGSASSSASRWAWGSSGC